MEKLTCGSCGNLARDGQSILRLQKPADVIIKADSPGSYQAVIEEQPGGNRIILRRQIPGSHAQGRTLLRTSRVISRAGTELTVGLR